MIIRSTVKIIFLLQLLLLCFTYSIADKSNSNSASAEGAPTVPTAPRIPSGLYRPKYGPNGKSGENSGERSRERPKDRSKEKFNSRSIEIVNHKLYEKNDRNPHRNYEDDGHWSGYPKRLFENHGSTQNSNHYRKPNNHGFPHYDEKPIRGHLTNAQRGWHFAEPRFNSNGNNKNEYGNANRNSEESSSEHDNNNYNNNHNYNNGNKKYVKSNEDKERYNNRRNSNESGESDKDNRENKETHGNRGKMVKNKEDVRKTFEEFDRIVSKNNGNGNNNNQKYNSNRRDSNEEDNRGRYNSNGNGNSENGKYSNSNERNSREDNGRRHNYNKNNDNNSKSNKNNNEEDSKENYGRSKPNNDQNSNENTRAIRPVEFKEAEDRRDIWPNTSGNNDDNKDSNVDYGKDNKKNYNKENNVNGYGKSGGGNIYVPDNKSEEIIEDIIIPSTTSYPPRSTQRSGDFRITSPQPSQAELPRGPPGIETGSNQNYPNKRSSQKSGPTFINPNIIIATNDTAAEIATTTDSGSTYTVSSTIETTGTNNNIYGSTTSTPALIESSTALTNFAPNNTYFTGSEILSGSGNTTNSTDDKLQSPIRMNTDKDNNDQLSKRSTSPADSTDTTSTTVGTRTSTISPMKIFGNSSRKFRYATRQNTTIPNTNTNSNLVTKLFRRQSFE